MLTRTEIPLAIPQRHESAPEHPLADWWRAARHRHRTRRLLAEMNDSMLKDIGLTRSEAQLELQKPFWRL
jgi:uncharacterized protein YjiS (DUF1127 family)